MVDALRCLASQAKAPHSLKGHTVAGALHLGAQDGERVGVGDCVELAPLPGDDVTRIAQVGLPGQASLALTFGPCL